MLLTKNDYIHATLRLVTIFFIILLATLIRGVVRGGLVGDLQFDFFNPLSGGIGVTGSNDGILSFASATSARSATDEAFADKLDRILGGVVEAGLYIGSFARFILQLVDPINSNGERFVDATSYFAVAFLFSYNRVFKLNQPQETVIDTGIGTVPIDDIYIYGDFLLKGRKGSLSIWSEENKSEGNSFSEFQKAYYNDGKKTGTERHVDPSKQDGKVLKRINKNVFLTGGGFSKYKLIGIYFEGGDYEQNRDVYIIITDKGSSQEYYILETNNSDIVVGDAISTSPNIVGQRSTSRSGDPQSSYTAPSPESSTWKTITSFWVRNTILKEYQTPLTLLIYFSVARYFFGEEFFTSIGIMIPFGVFPAWWLYSEYIDGMIGKTRNALLKWLVWAGYPSSVLLTLLTAFSFTSQKLYQPLTSFVALVLYVCYSVVSVYHYQNLVKLVVSGIFPTSAPSKRALGEVVHVPPALKITAEESLLVPSEVQPPEQASLKPYQQLSLICVLISLASLMYFTGDAMSWKISDIVWVLGVASLVIVPAGNILVDVIGENYIFGSILVCILTLVGFLKILRSGVYLDIQVPDWSYFFQQLEFQIV